MNIDAVLGIAKKFFPLIEIPHKQRPDIYFI